MSVFKKKESPFWFYSFDCKGHRFYGSTGVTSKTEAREIEKAARIKARRSIELSNQGETPITVLEVCSIYMAERGQFEVNAVYTQNAVKRLVKDLGKHKLLQDITERQLQTIIARRRADQENSTVNRTFTHLLRRIWRHAAPKVDQPDWKRLNLPEPRERIRELHEDEEIRILEHLRDDFVDPFLFSLETGLRQAELIELKWRDIDLHAQMMKIQGKGSRGSGEKIRYIPITSTCREILERNRKHVTYVFTYEQQRASHGRRRGERRQMTRSMLNRPWQTALKDAEIDDFRWHDLRHTAATRLLRRTGNISLVQQLLGHEDITTTRKYAHTTIEDLRAGMEANSETCQIQDRKHGA